jgi:UDP-3-O-[3-hydroxymyristoyl] N-acetylglucosamine deacetylase
MLTSAHQHTIAQNTTLTGVGVHSGAAASITIKSAAAHSGIVFVRTDISGRDNVIPARFDSVVDTRLCTVLGNKAGVTVSTVEHLMAAFAAMGLDNAVVEIDGPEMPIMDGSSVIFMEAMKTAGLQAQAARRRVIKVLKTVSVQEGDKETILSPADSSFYGFEIAFDSAAIGRQKYTFELKDGAFNRDIASARTFGFLHEVEALRKMGLARGGSLDNAVVVDGDTVMNPDGLRFKNEFVRHKILDAVGDLYLAGMQIQGHYHGIKAGHAMNNRILQALFADTSAFAIVEMAETAPRKAAKAAAAQEWAVPVLA